ncbi:hypothetical protein H4J56_13845 [Colwellia sp. BRX8-4]|uniref:HNH endonuclease n=1 Tax=Colwellia sp. BRX8-4 TaxID=2759836 RepID=UPI0015F73995|nr:HNH endonuclease [Colwellia sp. BRX8-4]MBA6362325.1 hypothetical protein [Colwellia sp. BRX8-8]MBA6372502.1 hypothetical protein [Colwellia sp. BRX8-4]
MAISLKTQKMLWGRAASRCAFASCKTELVMDATETDDESLVGEACHIIARSVDGPRGESDLSSEQRDKYGNLLLLCNVHHKVIDDQPGEYTVEKLKAIKQEHESWVKQQLKIFDASKQRDDEIYATYIDKFESLIDTENWNAWTSYLLSNGQPSIWKTNKDNLEELRLWLLNRVWPKRYKTIELAFENFRRVLQDFLNKFDQHAIEWGDDQYLTEKFYKNYSGPFDQSRYDSIFIDWEYHCYLVEDLTLELNRAANYIFDKVRDELSHSYRLSEGILLVTSGPHMDLSFKTHRVEYRGTERTEIPYGGLKDFEEHLRFQRDLYFGEKA